MWVELSIQQRLRRPFCEEPTTNNWRGFLVFLLNSHRSLYQSLSGDESVSKIHLPFENFRYLDFMSELSHWAFSKQNYTELDQPDVSTFFEMSPCLIAIVWHAESTHRSKLERLTLKLTKADILFLSSHHYVEKPHGFWFFYVTLLKRSCWSSQLLL